MFLAEVTYVTQLFQAKPQCFLNLPKPYPTPNLTQYCLSKPNEAVLVPKPNPVISVPKPRPVLLVPKPHPILLVP